MYRFKPGPWSIDHQESTPLAYTKTPNSRREDQESIGTPLWTRVLLLFGQRPETKNHDPLNGSNRHPHSRASEASPRTVPPSRRVFGRLCVDHIRPCVGQDNNQALCGHQNLPAGNHRTLQAFYRQPPSWEAETWGDDLQIQFGEEAT
jgi:hypothetical protein